MPGWTVERMTGFSMTHPIVAHAPECPPGPHPTRDCRCRVFRNTAQAQAYIDEQKVGVSGE